MQIRAGGFGPHPIRHPRVDLCPPSTELCLLAGLPPASGKRVASCEPVQPWTSSPGPRNAAYSCMLAYASLPTEEDASQQSLRAGISRANEFGSPMRTDMLSQTLRGLALESRRGEVRFCTQSLSPLMCFAQDEPNAAAEARQSELEYHPDEPKEHYPCQESSAMCRY